MTATSDSSSPLSRVAIKPGSWLSIFCIFLLGVTSGFGVSKLIPLQGDFHRIFNTSATDFGFLFALVGIPAALLALPSGLVVDRYGPRNVLITCFLGGVAINVGYSVCDSFTLFQLLRFMEGAFVVFTYTAAPAYLMASVEGTRRGSAMSLWATYMPVSVTLALFVSGMFAGGDHWRYPFIINAGACLLLLLVTLLQKNIVVVQEVKSLLQRLREVGRAYTTSRIFLLGLSFFIVISLGLGANITFPGYFTKLHDISMAQSSSLVASVTMAMVLGSLVVGLAQARGISPKHLFTTTALLGVLFGSLSFYPALSLEFRVAITAVWFVISGAATANLMTVMPIVAGPEERASAAALVNQGGAVATFVSPPIWFSFAAGDSWLPFAGLMLGGWFLSCSGVWIMLAINKSQLAPANSRG